MPGSPDDIFKTLSLKIYTIRYDCTISTDALLRVLVGLQPEELQSVAKVLGTLNGITFYDGVLSF